MLKFLSILFCATLLAPDLFAEQEFVTRFSLSKQFVVYGPKAVPARRFQSQRVPLDAGMVAVSCERIKQAVIAELEGTERQKLNFSNQGEGKIYAVLHPKVGQPVIITPIPTSENLNYRIDLPNQIEAARLIEVITETVLLEMVNRRSTDQFTQIPRWLMQGMAAQVQSAAPETLVLEQHLPMTRVKLRPDPIAEIRKTLKNSSPLTFDELSWPEILSPEKAARYRECSHLLVHELLHLKNGRACLRKMLEVLPNHPSWQVAFMRGFESHFRQLVEVEKWWELTLVNLTGRDPNQVLSHEQSIERIDAALNVPVQVFHDFGALPDQSNLTLQEIVSNWEPARQTQALLKVVSQLRVLRLRVQPEIVALVDDYRTVLENYLQNQEKGLLKRVFTRSDLAELTQSICRRLNVLDQNRTALRNKPIPKPSTRDEAILSALEIVSERSVGSPTKQ